MPRWVLEPGMEFMAVWGTGYETGRAYLENDAYYEVYRRKAGFLTYSA